MPTALTKAWKMRLSKWPSHLAICRIAADGSHGFL